VARLSIYVVVEPFVFKRFAKFLCRLSGDEKAALLLGEIERTPGLPFSKRKALTVVLVSKTKRLPPIQNVA
jgi:hypothetical protein